MTPDNPSRLLFNFQAGRLDWLGRMFMHSEIKFSSPKTFNDPWDCRPVFENVDEYTIDERRHLIERWWKADPQGAPNANVYQHVLQDMCSTGQFHGWIADIERLYKCEVMDEWHVYCLSETNDIDLMWSHYADRHRGVCLGFAFNTPIINQAKPVLYRKKLKRQKIPAPSRTANERFARTALRTKSASWKYEKEWRVLLRRNSGCGPAHTCPNDPDACVTSFDGYSSIDLSGLVSITFGVNFSPWERHTVCRIARSHGWTGRFQEAIKSEDDYKLVIRDLPI